MCCNMCEFIRYQAPMCTPLTTLFRAYEGFASKRWHASYH